MQYKQHQFIGKKFSMISILITNYNKGSFLFKNLKLLKKSKFKNFEIIIHDDNSSDDQ